jgi:hypothetical protein
LRDNVSDYFEHHNDHAHFFRHQFNHPKSYHAIFTHHSCSVTNNNSHFTPPSFPQCNATHSPVPDPPHMRHSSPVHFSLPRPRQDRHSLVPSVPPADAWAIACHQSKITNRISSIANSLCVFAPLRETMRETLLRVSPSQIANRRPSIADRQSQTVNRKFLLRLCAFA